MSVLSYESIKKHCEDKNVKLVDPFDYNFNNHISSSDSSNSDDFE